MMGGRNVFEIVKNVDTVKLLNKGHPFCKAFLGLFS